MQSFPETSPRPLCPLLLSDFLKQYAIGIILTKPTLFKMQMFWKARIVKSKYLPSTSLQCVSLYCNVSLCVPDWDSQCNAVCPCVSKYTVMCPCLSLYYRVSLCVQVHCSVSPGVPGWFFAPVGLFATFFVPTLVLKKKETAP